MTRRHLAILAVLVAVAALVLLSLDHWAPPPPATHHSFGRGPSIVIVHDLGSGSADWLPTARMLARDFRVTLVDLPGHGQAAMPRPLSLEQARLALDRVLAGGDEPVILVGHGLGGLVAAAAALEHPQRVRGLMLIETSLRPRETPEQRSRALEALDHDYDRFLRRRFLALGRDSAQGERLAAQAAAFDPAVMRPWLRLALLADLTGQIKKLLPPLYAIFTPHSWSDRRLWPSLVEMLGYQGVPRLRVARLDDCGYFPMLDRPRELSALIREFAKKPGGEPMATR